MWSCFSHSAVSGLAGRELHGVHRRTAPAHAGPREGEVSSVVTRWRTRIFRTVMSHFESACFVYDVLRDRFLEGFFLRKEPGAVRPGIAHQDLPNKPRNGLVFAA